MVKKIIAALLCVLMVLSIFCSCGNNTEAKTDTSVSGTEISETDTSSSDNEIQEVNYLEGCELSEREMYSVIKDYFKILEKIMKNAGQNANIKVSKNSDGVTVKNGSTSSYTWHSITSLYTYLYRDGQVDLEGNILVSETDKLIDPDTETAAD